MLKCGAAVNLSSDDNDYELGYFIAGPSYSFKAGNTTGVVSLMGGVGIEKTTYTGYDYGYGYSHYYDDDEKINGVFGISYTHRFFTNHRWNLLVGADVINETYSFNLGFAVCW